jgi:alginate O-acetyltransferase complex protein AlgF
MALLLAIAALSPAHPQSRSIYGGGVDEDAALVRLVDAGAASPVSVRIGGITLSVAGAGDSTPYRPVAPDIYMLTYAGRRFEFLPETGGWYTIVAASRSLLVLSDEKHLDAARAQLYFYNLAQAPLELRTADGSTRVLGPLAAGSSAQASVNPITVKLAAYGDMKKAGADIDFRLERGSSYSVFTHDSPAGIRTFAVKAAASTE